MDQSSKVLISASRRPNMTVRQVLVYSEYFSRHFADPIPFKNSSLACQFTGIPTQGYNGTICVNFWGNKTVSKGGSGVEISLSLVEGLSRCAHLSTIYVVYLTHFPQ